MASFRASILFSILFLATADIPEEDHVLVLDSSNIEEALEEYPDILVMFYAPWSVSCQNLLVEYVKAAEILKDRETPIRIAKIDSTKNTELSSKSQVRSFPTVKYFVHKVPTNYTGGKTGQEIVDWVLSKQGPTYRVTDSEGLELELEHHPVVFVEFAAEPSPTFNKVAKSMDKVMFIVCTERESYAEYEVEEGDMVLFKNYDELKTVYDGEGTVDDIIKWLIFNKRPWVMHYNDETMEHIYRHGNTVLFIFRHEDKALDYSNLLHHLSKSMRGHIAITHTDLSIEPNDRLGIVLGLKPEDQPIAFIMDPGDHLKRYKFEGEEFTAEALAEWVNHYKQDKLKTHFKSDPIPKNPYDRYVRVLVGKNANDTIYNLKKDVFFLYYAHWCKHSQKLLPEYDLVGEAFKDDDSIIIAKLDGSHNEVPGLNLISYPTMKFFTANNKAGITYEGEHLSGPIIEFIKANAVARTMEKDPSDEL
mmetsp:Transcript_19268/g.35353  ORF Transcript_19268/g.35353 Transcript_19268/m.35353 type:complete len:476 (+) Transcript_19268:2352-3779(+)